MSVLLKEGLLRLSASVCLSAGLLVGCGGGGGGGDNPPPAVTHQVSANAGEGGSVTPSQRTVNDGSSTTFTVTADTGYTIASVTGCGGSLSGTTYTTGAVTADCAVEAQFSLRQYSLTASAGEGGSINPASQAIGHGLTAQFEVTVDEGYEIASVTGCGGSLSGTTYTTGAVTADCAVEASFQLPIVANIEGSVIDEKIVGALVVVQELATQNELGRGTTDANGRYRVGLTAQSGAYLVRSIGGTLGAEPFVGEMVAICLPADTANCLVTPFSTLLAELQAVYLENDVAIRLSRARQHLSYSLDLDYDPFVADGSDAVDLALIRSQIGNGEGLENWVMAVASDIPDGHIDEPALMPQFLAKMERSTAFVPVSVDSAALDELLADPGTPSAAA